MRSLGRWLALAIVLIVAGVAVTYRQLIERQQRQATPPPKPLPTGLSGTASGWQWAYSQHGKTMVEVRAKQLEQVKDPSVFDLTGVELKIFHDDNTTFDRVTSGKSRFSTVDGKMYSDGDVTMELAMPAGGSPNGRLLTIRSSGVSFDNKTGKADTDRHAVFSLDIGEGESDGAVYDPQTHELRLKRNAKLTWRGHEPTSAPMFIEAPELLYKEHEQKVFLSPTAKFSRGTLSMTGGPTVLTIENGNIRLVQTEHATGSQKSDARLVNFGAEKLDMIFRDKGLMEKITGEKNASLESNTATTHTTVHAERLDLSFDEGGSGAELARAYATGSSVLESAPVRKDVPDAPDTRVLKSEVIEMKMRKGGEEIEELVTHSPGTVDFLPNRPNTRKRRLEGDRMNIAYGSGNQIRSFRTTKAATRTEPLSQPGKRSLPPQLTWSDDLQAEFDPKTGDMTTLEQWNHFRFQEGAREARAERATLDQDTNLVTLKGAARIWDPTGSTDADTIQIDNKNEVTIATGNVRSVREPETEPAKGPSSGPNNRGEKIRATAAKMTTRSNNSKILYEGQAVLWQGDNRINADCIDIDRAARRLKAKGNVVNFLKDRNQTVMTVISSESMDYSDVDKVAFYEGKVVLDRPGLNVKSRKLRAYLSEDQEEVDATVPDSGLEKAYAEGAVEILQSDPAKTRFGVGEQAEYLVADGMVVLEGGSPKLTETLKGQKPSVTQGRRLTWYSNNDKLLVDGAGDKQSESNLRRSKKK